MGPICLYKTYPLILLHDIPFTYHNHGFVVASHVLFCNHVQSIYLASSATVTLSKPFPGLKQRTSWRHVRT